MQRGADGGGDAVGRPALLLEGERDLVGHFVERERGLGRVAAEADRAAHRRRPERRRIAIADTQAAGDAPAREGRPRAAPRPQRRRLAGAARAGDERDPAGERGVERREGRRNDMADRLVREANAERVAQDRGRR